VLILASAQYLERPPEGYLEMFGKNEKTGTSMSFFSETDAKSALKTTRFYYIWVMMFINISCGIALISSASPMLQQTLSYTPMQAATIVGLIGVFNGLGRLLWSSLSDYFGRANIFIMFFAFQIVAFYYLPQIPQEYLFLAIMFTVITMYGGGFSTLPAFLCDLFGTKQLGSILGMVLAAWGLAGVVGPSIYDYYMMKTNMNLEDTLKIFSYMFVVALAVSIPMKITVAKARKRILHQNQ